MVQLVSYILGTNFAQSVEWLEENYPQLNTTERLSKLDKSQFFAKTKNCKDLEKEYKKLLKENKNLKTKLALLKKLDTEKIKLLQKLQKENKKLKEKK